MLEMHVFVFFLKKSFSWIKSQKNPTVSCIEHVQTFYSVNKMNTTLVNRFNQDFIEDSVCSSTEACRKAIIITKPNISENTKKQSGKTTLNQ